MEKAVYSAHIVFFMCSYWYAASLIALLSSKRRMCLADKKKLAHDDIFAVSKCLSSQQSVDGTSELVFVISLSYRR